MENGWWMKSIQSLFFLVKGVFVAIFLKCNHRRNSWGILEDGGFSCASGSSFLVFPTQLHDDFHIFSIYRWHADSFSKSAKILDGENFLPGKLDFGPSN